MGACWEPSKEEAIAAANNARSNLLNHQTILWQPGLQLRLPRELGLLLLLLRLLQKAPSLLWLPASLLQRQS